MKNNLALKEEGGKSSGGTTSRFGTTLGRNIYMSQSQSVFIQDTESKAHPVRYSSVPDQTKAFEVLRDCSPFLSLQ